MRTILLLAICLTSFFGLSQESSDYEDTINNDIYTLLDFNKWTIEEFIPSEENLELSKLTRITYNPMTNLYVLDSILKYRESKGYKPLDYSKVESKILNNQIDFVMDISRAEVSKVIMREIQGVANCDCDKSIIKLILDDSLEYNKIKFKDILLNNNIKRIEVNYYQVRRKNDSNKKEEHLIIGIKKRFHLFKEIYEVI